MNYEQEAILYGKTKRAASLFSTSIIFGGNSGEIDRDCNMSGGIHSAQPYESLSSGKRFLFSEMWVTYRFVFEDPAEALSFYRRLESFDVRSHTTAKILDKATQMNAAERSAIDCIDPYSVSEGPVRSKDIEAIYYGLDIWSRMIDMRILYGFSCKESSVPAAFSFLNSYTRHVVMMFLEKELEDLIRETSEASKRSTRTDVIQGEWV